jgi:transcriptional antiterminator NusG
MKREFAQAKANMIGTVESFDDRSGRLRVMVEIFGRPTPLELNVNQVEKLS